MKIASIAVDTLGCKLNQAESDNLVREFIKAGYQVVQPDQNADIYILNTCTVTHVADRKARHLLRKARRRNPDATLIATGCYAKRAPRELNAIDGVDLVIEDRHRLISMIADAGYLPDNKTSHTFRTRAMLKIQQGCNRKCAYCIVPQTRGEEMSIPTDKVLDEVDELIKDGFKEIVLTGTHIGSHDNLRGLVEQILERTQIKRLRLSSLQPTDITPSLLTLWQDQRLCRHIHLPLQSGSDSVLSRMKRWYSTLEFENAVNMAREAIQEVSVTTDIIVGFPAETETEFEQSYDFCRRMEFANIHVFTYSPRPNTTAAVMDNLSPQIKKKRSNEMLKLGKALSQRFNSRFIGCTMLVLWESKYNRYMEGLTDNYVRVFSPTSRNVTNELLQAKLISIYKNGLLGELV